MVLVPKITLGIAPNVPEPAPLIASDWTLGEQGPVPTFCGALPSELGAAARGQMRWKQRHLQWCWIDRIPGLTLEKQIDDTKWAFDQWAQASNGYFSYEPTSDAKACDILLTTARMDGSGRVLADMMLPPGDDRQLRGRFDTGEQWDTSIIFKLVLLHELGHAKGINHINDRAEQSVLDASYNPRLTRLQRLDIDRLLTIYPEARDFKPAPTPTPVPTPIPTPAPTPSQPEQWTIVIPSLGTYSGPMRRIL